MRALIAAIVALAVAAIIVLVGRRRLDRGQGHRADAVRRRLRASRCRRSSWPSGAPRTRSGRRRAATTARPGRGRHRPRTRTRGRRWTGDGLCRRVGPVSESQDQAARRRVGEQLLVGLGVEPPLGGRELAAGVDDARVGQHAPRCRPSSRARSARAGRWSCSACPAASTVWIAQPSEESSRVAATPPWTEPIGLYIHSAGGSRRSRVPARRA